MAPLFELRTLGSLGLKGPDGHELEALLAQTKRVALLTYLAVATPRGFHRRDKLVTVFWPELDQEHARSALRTALRVLREALGDGALNGRGQEEVRLEPAQWWCDAVAFQELLEAGRWEEALELYRDDFLDGFHLSGCPEFERWEEGERARLKAHAAEAAWHLAKRAEAVGNTAAAVHWARRAAEFCADDEAVLRQLIGLLDRVGDRAGAVHAYDAFARQLKEELDAEPAPETRALMEAVRARVDPNGTVVQVPSPSSATLDTQVTSGATHWSGVRRSFSFTGRRGAVAGAVALAALLVVGGAVVANGRGDGRTLDPTRVLVDVFENRSGDPALDPLGLRATDRITAGLTYTGFVDVISLGTPLLTRVPADADDPGRNGKTPLYALAEANGAGTIVWGSFYRQHDSVRFEAQVVRGLTGEVLATVEPVKGPADAPEQALEVLRDRVMTALATLTDPRLAKWARYASKPPTFEAYEQFVEGIELHTTHRKYREAIPKFLRAAALDSSFTMPLLWAILAYRNVLERPAAESLARALDRRRGELAALDRHYLDYHLADLRWDDMAALRAMRRFVEIAPGSEYLKLAAGAALAVNHPREAIEFLTQADPESGWLRGWVPYWGRFTAAYHRLGDHRKELETARRGRRQYRSDTEALWYEMRALAALGRLEELNARFEEGQQLRWREMPGGAPRDAWAMWNAGRELRAHGHGAAASQFLNRVLHWIEGRAAEDKAYRRYVALVLWELGRLEEAGVLVEQVVAEEPKNTDWLGNLALSAAYKGDRAEAFRLTRLLDEIPDRPTWGPLYLRARLAAVLGEREQAMALLREAIANGFSDYEFLHVSSSLESLWHYPPFQDLLRPKG